MDIRELNKLYRADNERLERENKGYKEQIERIASKEPLRNL